MTKTEMVRAIANDILHSLTEVQQMQLLRKQLKAFWDERSVAELRAECKERGLAQ